MNKILDGKLVSSNIKEQIKKEVVNLKIKPTLVVIQIGHDEASNVYILSKRKAALNLGFNFEHINFETTVNEETVISKIKELNNNKQVNGIIVQLPIPTNFNTHKIINTINPIKDVDGLTNINLGKLVTGEDTITSCTPSGIIELLDAYNISLEGKHAVIVGRSNLVGKPLLHMLLKKNATVTIAHSKTTNLKEITKSADILIVAVGKKHLIKASMIKNDAIVIDVGINKIDGVIYGDVDFNDVIDKVSYITPVPGGVGPLTVAMLLKNTLKSYYLMQKDK